MSNTIQTMSKYMPLLDSKYSVESVSSILDASPEIYRETESAGTVMLPVMSLSGLGDYSRNDGFAKGDASIAYKPYTFSCDRGRMFTIDAMDDLENAGLAFGSLAAEFISTHVAPELDAYRFSTYAAVAGQNAQQNSEVALTAQNIVSEIDAAIEALDNAEVPEEDRVLFMTNKAYNLLKNAEFNVTRVSTSGVDRRTQYFDGIEIVKVPQSRMYTEFNFKSGVGADVDGGFAPAADAVSINFILMSKKAPLQIVKLAKLKIVTPENNPEADAYKFGYRLYHDAFVPENKKNGIYASIGV